MLELGEGTMVAATVEERRGSRQDRMTVPVGAGYVLLETFCCLPLLSFSWLLGPRCDMSIRRDRGHDTWCIA